MDPLTPGTWWQQNFPKIHCWFVATGGTLPTIDKNKCRILSWNWLSSIVLIKIDSRIVPQSKVIILLIISDHCVRIVFGFLWRFLNSRRNSMQRCCAITLHHPIKGKPSQKARSKRQICKQQTAREARLEGKLANKTRKRLRWSFCQSWTDQQSSAPDEAQVLHTAQRI